MHVDSMHATEVSGHETMRHDGGCPAQNILPPKTCTHPANNSSHISKLDLEAKYIGKMFAEVAKAMSQRRFPRQGEYTAEMSVLDLHTLHDQINHHEKIPGSSLPFYPGTPAEEIQLTGEEASFQLSDIEYVPIDSDQSVLGEVTSIEGQEENIYSSDLMKDLARAKESSGMHANLVYNKVSLPSDWELVSPMQTLNCYGTPNQTMV